MVDPDQQAAQGACGARGRRRRRDGVAASREARAALDLLRPARRGGGSRAFAQEPRLDGGSLGFGGRLAAAWRALWGEPRHADVWAVHYLRFETGLECLLLVLAGRRERRAHSELPLTLPGALRLADELDAAATALS
jgi:hypothetical protein